VFTDIANFQEQLNLWSAQIADIRAPVCGYDCERQVHQQLEHFCLDLLCDGPTLAANDKVIDIRQDASRQTAAHTTKRFHPNTNRRV